MCGKVDNLILMNKDVISFWYVWYGLEKFLQKPRKYPETIDEQTTTMLKYVIYSAWPLYTTSGSTYWLIMS